MDGSGVKSSLLFSSSPSTYLAAYSFLHCYPNSKAVKPFGTCE